MVVGVNHHALANASYVNLSVYHLEKLLGVTEVTQDRLYGSAGAYAPAGELLYAYKVARNCGGDPNCMTIPAGFPGVPPGKPISLVERAYLEAETGVGPRYDELVLPVFVRFQP